MLPLATVEEICRLLAEGQLSQRKIAQKLGVSRGTISAVATGKRGIYGREPTEDKSDVCNFDTPAERCPGCGGMVHKPCLLCRTRRYVAGRRAMGESGAGRRVA